MGFACVIMGVILMYYTKAESNSLMSSNAKTRDTNISFILITVQRVRMNKVMLYGDIASLKFVCR